MKLIFLIIRKLKANFFRFKLHIFFKPFIIFFSTLIQISKLSEWVSKTPMPKFNDFYSKKHDYNKRYDLYSYIIRSENLDEIYFLEFGVAKGKSFNWWVKNIKSKNSRFVGFDTFTGLPEDWGLFKKGEMSSEGGFPIINDKRCSFEKGIFQQTLPWFLLKYKSNLRKVVHMDADIYTSTLFVLTQLGPYLNKDDILLFDEFNVPMHEFKAFTEFKSAFYIKTEMIGAVNNYYQTAFKIVENPSYRK